ncbi:MAG: PDZ domain-containing protein [Balneolaceae bacterium]|nr:PDZ domain-containing protein [Balneolaceae bacterium]MBO6547645.1 PDZ domain-containing protein [Balneolaceae bacterium]MBO6648156.1 PDZ domain-containing protein [Balneolaceae bacterium]
MIGLKYKLPLLFVCCFLTFSSVFAQKFIPRVDGFHGMYLKKDPTGKTNHPMVMGVAKDSPADKANMTTGYLITEIDGIKIDLSTTTMEMVNLLLSGSEGTEVLLTLSDIYVPGKIIKLELTLAGKPTTNQLIYDPPELSQYFPTRLKNCIGMLESNSDDLKGEFLQVDENQYSRYTIKNCFLNDSQKGTYRERDNSKEISKVTFHELSHALQDRDLAASYLEELISSSQETLTEIAPFIKTEEEQIETSGELEWTDLIVRFTYQQKNVEYQVIFGLVGDQFGDWDIHAILTFSISREELSGTQVQSPTQPSYQPPQKRAPLKPVMEEIYNNLIASGNGDVSVSYLGHVPMPTGGDDLEYRFEVRRNTVIILYALTNADCYPYVLMYDAETGNDLHYENQIFKEGISDDVRFYHDKFETHIYSKDITIAEITFGYSSTCKDYEKRNSDMELMIFSLR